MSQPLPPPSVSPAMPTSESVPPGTARPKACVARSSSPHNTPPRARATGRCIDLNCLHEREVDHKSIIADRGTGTTVSASPHCDEKLVLAGKPHCDHDILLVCAKRD